MHKIKIIDVNQEKQFFEKNFAPYKIKQNKEISIKINDSLFEIGLRKGLIEKNDDGYYFIGDYEELLAFKNKKLAKGFQLLD